MGFQPMTLRDLRGTQRIVSVKLSVRKALNPLRFTKGNFHLEFSMANLRLSVFGLIKMSFQVPKKGQLRFSERK